MVISAIDLRFSYAPAPDTQRSEVLAGLSFEVAAGECLVVIGPNACGKSTLCHALAGLAPRLTGGRLSGNISVAGRDVQAEPPGALPDVVGLVLQDVTGQLFNATIENEVAWGLENLGMARDAMRVRIRWALEVVGLQDVPPDQPPGALSGGQQKRLALAAALALRPAVLILDEPTAGLDPAGRKAMVAALRNLQDVTLFVTESDPDVVLALADRVAVLREGQLAYTGTPTEVYGRASALADSGVRLPPAADFAARLNAELATDYDFLTLDDALVAYGASD